jgi:hypothetical protein
MTAGGVKRSAGTGAESIAGIEYFNCLIVSMENSAIILIVENPYIPDRADNSDVFFP